MTFQIPLIPEDLPNSSVIIDETDLTTKLLHPIFYVYDIGNYRLDSLVKKREYKYPIEKPNAIVKIQHNGTVRLPANVDKLSVDYDYSKDFENVYDYENPASKISKVLIKNKIIVYHNEHKLLMLTNGKNAKNIINCIKNDIVCTLETNKIKKEDIKNIKNSILYSKQIDIDLFMKYLVENHNANVKAIYAGNLVQKENKAITIYGDETNKSQLYEYIKNQGSKLSCVTVKLLLNSYSNPKNILFTNNGGIMIFGYISEELAIKIVLECDNLIEKFINGSSKTNN